MNDKSEPVTLEQLAQLVAEGFTRNEERFTAFEKALEERFSALDGKIDREISGLASMVKTQFDHVEDRFEIMGQEFKEMRDEMNTRFEGVHARLRNLDNRLDTFATHERRIKQLEQEWGCHLT